MSDPLKNTKLLLQQAQKTDNDAAANAGCAILVGLAVAIIALFCIGGWEAGGWGLAAIGVFLIVHGCVEAYKAARKDQ